MCASGKKIEGDAGGGGLGDCQWFRVRGGGDSERRGGNHRGEPHGQVADTTDGDTDDSQWRGTGGSERDGDESRTEMWGADRGVYDGSGVHHDELRDPEPGSSGRDGTRDDQ